MLISFSGTAADIPTVQLPGEAGIGRVIAGDLLGAIGAWMAHYPERTHAEIAERTGLALGTVKSDIRRGLARLRRHLEGFDAAPRS